MALPLFRFDHEVPSLSSPFYVDTLALAAWRPTDRIPFFNLKGSWGRWKRNGEAREMHSFGKSWILIRYLLSALCCKLHVFNGHIYITRDTHTQSLECVVKRHPGKARGELRVYASGPLVSGTSAYRHHTIFNFWATTPLSDATEKYVIDKLLFINIAFR